MKGLIGIDHYKVDCVIGVYPEERTKHQSIFIDLHIETDLSQCILSDDIRHTVNYENLAQICTELATSRRYKLLETFAGEVVNSVFKQFNVSWARIRIKKPNGLSPGSFSVVELERYSP